MNGKTVIPPVIPSVRDPVLYRKMADNLYGETVSDIQKRLLDQMKVFYDLNPVAAGGGFQKDVKVWEGLVGGGSALGKVENKPAPAPVVSHEMFAAVLEENKSLIDQNAEILKQNGELVSSVVQLSAQNAALTELISSLRLQLAAAKSQKRSCET